MLDDQMTSCGMEPGPFGCACVEASEGTLMVLDQSKEVLRGWSDRGDGKTVNA